MTYCIHCGAALPEGARFCPVCGKATETQPAVSDTARGNAWRSPSTDDNSQFCPKPAPASTGHKADDIEYRKECPQCHQLLADEADRCDRCGYTFGIGSQLSIDRVACPCCGSMIPDTARVCPECGCRPKHQGIAPRHGAATIPSPTPSAAKQQDTSANQRHHGLAIGIIAVIITLALALLWVFNRQGLTATDEDCQEMPADQTAAPDDELSAPGMYAPGQNSGTEEDANNNADDYDESMQPDSEIQEEG